MLIQPPKSQQMQDTTNTAASLLDIDANPTEVREFPLVRLNSIQIRHFEVTCVIECYFRDHMAERDLLFHELVAPPLAAYDPESSKSQQHDFLTHLHATLNAPSHPIRNRLLRLAADSPDLLGVIKREGRV